MRLPRWTNTGTCCGHLGSLFECAHVSARAVAASPLASVGGVVSTRCGLHQHPTSWPGPRSRHQGQQSGRDHRRDPPSSARHEGKYILKTDDPAIAPAEAVAIYKQLSDVESAYRDLKDVIRMSPIYHKTDRRALAHLFVATLALFVKRTLAHKLSQTGVAMTPTKAFAAMCSIGVSVLYVAGEQRLLASAAGTDARRIAAALGIRDINPPLPQKVTEASHRWQSRKSTLGTQGLTTLTVKHELGTAASPGAGFPYITIPGTRRASRAPARHRCCSADRPGTSRCSARHVRALPYIPMGAVRRLHEGRV